MINCYGILFSWSRFKRKYGMKKRIIYLGSSMKTKELKIGVKWRKKCLVNSIYLEKVQNNVVSGKHIFYLVTKITSMLIYSKRTGLSKKNLCWSNITIRLVISGPLSLTKSLENQIILLKITSTPNLEKFWEDLTRLFTLFWRESSEKLT